MKLYGLVFGLVTQLCVVVHLRLKPSIGRGVVLELLRAVLHRDRDVGRSILGRLWTCALVVLGVMD